MANLSEKKRDDLPTAAVAFPSSATESADRRRPVRSAAARFNQARTSDEGDREEG